MQGRAKLINEKIGPLNLLYQYQLEASPSNNDSAKITKTKQWVVE
jgi:hypothetical protein